MGSGRPVKYPLWVLSNDSSLNYPMDKSLQGFTYRYFYHCYCAVFLCILCRISMPSEFLNPYSILEVCAVRYLARFDSLSTYVQPPSPHSFCLCGWIWSLIYFYWTVQIHNHLLLIACFMLFTFSFLLYIESRYYPHSHTRTVIIFPLSIPLFLHTYHSCTKNHTTLWLVRPIFVLLSHLGKKHVT